MSQRYHPFELKVSPKRVIGGHPFGLILLGDTRLKPHSIYTGRRSPRLPGLSSRGFGSK